MNILIRFQRVKQAACLQNHSRAVTSILALLVLQSAAFMCCSTNTARASDAAAKLQLEISVNAQALKESRVQIDSTLSNGLEHSVKILIWNTPFAKQITGRLFHVDRHAGSFKFGDGKTAGGFSKLAYKGLMVKRGAPSEREYLVLQPGDKISNSLDITNAYDFVENGRHRITFDRPINLGNNSFHSLTSNTIEFVY